MIGLQGMDLGVDGLVLVCASILASFGALCWSAALGNGAARILAILEIALLFAGAWIWALAAGEVSAGCQENCEVASHAGRQDVQLALALLGLALLLVALRQTLLRRYSIAVGLTVAVAGCFGGWVASVAPLGNGFGI